MYFSIAPLLLFAHLLATSNASLLEEYQNLLNGNGTLSRRAAPTTISELYTSPNGLGACSAAQLSVMDLWVPEAQLMHSAIVTAYTDVADQGNRLLWSYLMGIRWTSTGTVASSSSTDWQRIGGRLSLVSKFILGGGLPNPKTNQPPYIFCGDEFAVLKPWNQPAQDLLGNYVQDQGRYLTINDVFYPNEIQNGATKNPFWVDELKAYDLDASGSSTTLCARPSRFAATSKPAKQSQVGPFVAGNPDQHTFFCPLSFRPQNAHTAASLLNAVTYANYPTSGSTAPAMTLPRLIPISGTFYHELYHLTDFTGVTEDPYTSIKQISDAARAQKEAITNNPESFLFMAVAAFIYSNAPPAPNANSPAKPAVVFGGGLPKSVADILAAQNP